MNDATEFRMMKKFILHAYFQCILVHLERFFFLFKSPVYFLAELYVCIGTVEKMILLDVLECVGL